MYLPALAGGFLTTSATWEAQLPIAAVTNYQNLNSLKQHRLFSYSSGGQKSRTKVVVSGPDSLQESQEGVFVTLLQCLVASGCPCVVDTSL